MKKKLLLCLSIALIAAMVITGTMAYFTDTESATNVMTIGNIDIEQKEQQRVDDGENQHELEPFKQALTLMPAAYDGESIAWAPADEWVVPGDSAWKVVADNGDVHDKFVTVTNIGSNEAYVRVIVAYEGDAVNGKDIHIVHNDETSSDPKVASKFAESEVLENVTIDGKRYDLIVYTYAEPVQPGETTIPSLKQIYMDKTTTQEEAAKYGATYDILVLSQAVQTAAGFEGAKDALDSAFGEVDAKKAAEWFANFRPEVEVDGNDVAALTAAINEAPEGSVVKLNADMDFGANTFTVEKNVVIDLNGNTVSSSARNGTFYLKNGASLKNGSVQHVGTVAAIKVWQAESIEDVTVILDGKSGSGNAITGISVQEGSNTYIGSLKNVKVISTGENKTYNGIETYNCGGRTDYAIGSMENVTVDVNGTALLLSAPAGTATNCSFKGGVCGINAHLKGAYNVSLKLVNCTVEGPVAVQAWDEPNLTNPGSLMLEVDENTTVIGDVVITPAESFGDRWVVNGFEND